jgi:hypothetical protein
MKIPFLLTSEHATFFILLKSNKRRPVNNYLWHFCSHKKDNKVYKLITKDRIGYINYLSGCNTLTTNDFDLVEFLTLKDSFILVNYRIYRITVLNKNEFRFLVLEYVCKYKKNSNVLTLNDIIYKVLEVDEQYLKLEPL